MATIELFSRWPPIGWNIHRGRSIVGRTFRFSRLSKIVTTFQSVGKQFFFFFRLSRLGWKSGERYRDKEEWSVVEKQKERARERERERVRREKENKREKKKEKETGSGGEERKGRKRWSLVRGRWRTAVRYSWWRRRRTSSGDGATVVLVQASLG